jgi:hypothetical protein
MILFAVFLSGVVLWIVAALAGPGERRKRDKEVARKQAEWTAYATKARKERNEAFEKAMDERYEVYRRTGYDGL